MAVTYWKGQARVGRSADNRDDDRRRYVRARSGEEQESNRLKRLASRNLLAIGIRDIPTGFTSARIDRECLENGSRAICRVYGNKSRRAEFESSLCV